MVHRAVALGFMPLATSRLSGNVFASGSSAPATLHSSLTTFMADLYEIAEEP